MKLNSLLSMLATTVAIGSGFVTETAHAASVKFTNRLSWEAAVTGFPLIEDSFDNEIPSALSITFDSGVISTNSQPGFNGFPGFPNINNRVSVFDQYENCVHDAAIVCSNAWTWKFPLPVIGFGAFFAGVDSGRLAFRGDFGSGEEIINVAETINPITSNNTLVDGFLGITAKKPFDTITFFSRSSNDFVNIDNLVFATVPEPSAIFSLGSVIAVGFGTFFKRKLSKKQKRENV
jgi:hypothetical protein